MHTGILPLSNRIVHCGCIHNLEDECDVLNNQLGDCMLEMDDIIRWVCPFYRCNVYELGEE
jgi:hypothetical protein